MTYFSLLHLLTWQLNYLLFYCFIYFKCNEEDIFHDLETSCWQCLDLNLKSSCARLGGYRSIQISWVMLQLPILTYESWMCKCKSSVSFGHTFSSALLHTEKCKMAIHAMMRMKFEKNVSNGHSYRSDLQC